MNIEAETARSSATLALTIKLQGVLSRKNISCHSQVYETQNVSLKKI